MDQTAISGTQNAAGIVPKPGWSWGAFLFNAYYLVAVKRYKLLWWYLLMLVPFVNVIFAIVFAIYIGLHGHEIGASGTQFANQSEYDGFTKAIDHAGKIFFIIFLILAVLWVIFFLSFGFYFLPTMHVSTSSPMP
jgi:hypothetical protein